MEVALRRKKQAPHSNVIYVWLYGCMVVCMYACKYVCVCGGGSGCASIHWGDLR